MNAWDREVATLSFSNEGLDRGCIEESMYPWDKTVANWKEQGYDTGFLDKVHFATLPTDNLYAYNEPYEPWQDYYNTMMAEPVFKHETGLGWDPVMRIAFRIPFISYDEEIREETDEYVIKRDRDGWVRKYPKNGGLVTPVKPVVTCMEDWLEYKAHIQEQIKRYLTPENMEKAYGRFREGCKNKDYVVRLRLSGFFWTPRFLMGNEEQLYAYYDEPEVLHDICRFVTDVYKEQLDGILKIVTPSLVFFEEDLSGKNGPMISPDIFEEFMTPYYKEIIPFLRERGVQKCDHGYRRRLYHHDSQDPGMRPGRRAAGGRQCRRGYREGERTVSHTEIHRRVQQAVYHRGRRGYRKGTGSAASGDPSGRMHRVYGSSGGSPHTAEILPVLQPQAERSGGGTSQ